MSLLVHHIKNGSAIKIVLCPKSSTNNRQQAGGIIRNETSFHWQDGAIQSVPRGVISPIDVLMSHAKTVQWEIKPHKEY